MVAALAEFLLSIRLYPTDSATFNAALCLHRLQRFDEALAMYEKLLRDYPDLATEDKTTAQRAITELYKHVGTLEITGAEPGASVVIGGQERGEFPPGAPLRVTAGTHIVRLFKQGFEPFETRVDVAGGQTERVVAKLKALTASGRLKVSEQAGRRPVDVLVDGVNVGEAPWEGTLSVGDHVVVLRGVDQLGTQPVAAPVSTGKLTVLSLRAEPLESSMRVEPTPPGATVSINSVQVGRGAWAGRLRAGSHRIEISGEGFVTATRDVTLEPGEREVLTLRLERDESAPIWQKPATVSLELAAGAALAPSFGGEVADSCKRDCAGGVAAGGLIQLHGGYELGSGLGFGVAAGYLAAFQDTRRRTGQLIPAVDQSPVNGTLNESLRIQGVLAGASVSYRFGETFPVLFRLGAGAFIGQARSERYGTFPDAPSAESPQVDQDSAQPDRFTTAPAATVQAMTYVYVEPELRLGYRLTERFELGLGVRALMLIALSQPRWDDSIEVDASGHGIGTYRDERLVGPFVAFLAPGASLRYTF